MYAIRSYYGDLRPIHVPSLTTLEHRGLVRMRATLVKDLTRYKNRVKSFLYFHGIHYPETFHQPGTHWSRRFIKWIEDLEFSDATSKAALTTLLEHINLLRETVLKTTRQIRELAKTDCYNKQTTMLCSIPGIGLITAMIILTEIVITSYSIHYTKLYDSCIPPKADSRALHCIRGRTEA